MRIFPIKKDKHDINDEWLFNHLLGNEETWEVDTVYYQQFSRPWRILINNLRDGEYIYIYIPWYKQGNEEYYGESIPVYGICNKNKNKIKWYRIDYPRTSEEIKNFWNYLHDEQPWQTGYINNEEDEGKRIKCEKIKEFLNNDKIWISKNYIAKLKKEIKKKIDDFLQKIYNRQKFN